MVFQLSPTPQAGRRQQLHKAAIPVIQIAEVGVDVHRRIELRTLCNGDEIKTDLTGATMRFSPACWIFLLAVVILVLSQALVVPGLFREVFSGCRGVAWCRICPPALPLLWGAGCLFRRKQ